MNNELIQHESNIPRCSWKRNIDGDCDGWLSGCGEEFVFTEGTPKENNFKYCPFCGLRIMNERIGKI